MKNIHVLPTDKPSRLCIREFDNKLCLNTTERIYHGINQHIYITNSEETKLKDWFISGSLVHKATDILDCDDDGKLEIHSNGYCNPLSLVKKIILTTDQDLIKDGVQAIDDDFLEWFVKNPSCEKVEVRKIEDELISPKNQKIRFNALQDPPSFIPDESLNNMILTYKYKIIIPKEEPKQEKFEHILYKGNVWEPPVQETLEEFAEKEAIKQYLENTFGNIIVRKSIEKGAKWQQERSYSEEEVYHILCEHTAFLFAGGKSTLTEWFEQFKNK